MKRKAQEEMVGLVIVMIVVSVIFLVFLTIFLRQNSSERRTESVEVSQFLDSIFEQTTSCTLNGYSYLNIRELIEECNKGGSNCQSGAPACELLKNEMKKTIESGWTFGSESETTNYELKIIYETDTGSQTPILNLRGSSAVCGLVKRGADKPISAQNGVIISTLNLCLS